MNEIIKKEDAPVMVQDENNVAQALIKMASDPNMDVGKLQALIDMQEQMQSNQAKQAFNAALVAFKANPPRIIKNQAVSFGNTKYSHATIDSVMRQLDPELYKHGLSFNWRIKSEPDMVEVVGVLRHELGYSEESYFTSKPDASGSKNQIQAQGSAITYGKRYTVLSALGLAEQGDDDDGIKAFMAKKVDENMLDELQQLIESANSDAQALCKHFKVGSLAEMSNQQYGAAKSMLNSKIRKGA